MDNKNKFYIVLATLGLTIFILAAATLSFKDQIFNLLFPKPASHAQRPAASPISRRTITRVSSAKGTITSLSQNQMTIQTESGRLAFSLAQTRDFQEVTSGTVEQNNAVTTLSTKNQLQSGQQVLVIWNKNATQSARAVYILRR